MCTAATPTIPDQSRLWSRYGMRIGFTSHRPQFHAGTDIGAPVGTAVFAPRAGVVEVLAHDEDGLRGNPFNGYGNAIAIRHDDVGLWSFFAHLSRIDVSPGQHVEAGEQIGATGRTNNGKFPGMSPHLHLELRHARPNGASPYPGPYRTNNLDPQPVLESWGVRLTRDGWSADPALDACPSPVVLPDTGMASLPLTAGGIAGDESDSADYEPPLTMDGDLIAVPWLQIAVGSGLTVLGVLGLRELVR